jgi:hypothetical protein
VTSTTTTENDTPQICPARQLFAADGGEMLDLLRRFRDQGLARSVQGRILTLLYYSHRIEMARILSDKPELAADARKLLTEIAAQMRGMAESGDTRLVLSRDQHKRSAALLQLAKQKASPALKKVLSHIAYQLMVGDLPAILR